MPLDVILEAKPQPRMNGLAYIDVPPGLASDHHYKQDFFPISASHSSEKGSMSQT